MSAFQLPFQKQTPTWSIAVKPRTAGQRLWASSRAIETSDALPSSSSSWAEAVGTGVVIQIKRLWGPSSRDAKPTWKQVHIVILLWGTISAKMVSQPWVQYYCYVAGGWILLPEQAVNCRQITVHGYQIHPTWILHPFESKWIPKVPSVVLHTYSQVTQANGEADGCILRHCLYVLCTTAAKQIQTHLHHTCLMELSSSPSHSSAQVGRASSCPSSVSWNQG